MRSLTLLFAACAAVILAGTGSAQIDNGSFEDNPSGVPSGWTNVMGATSVSAFADGDLPTDGVRYLSVSANGFPGAVPHSNPGGFGTDATGTGHALQQFSLPNGQMTTVAFDCQILVRVTALDFFEVSIEDDQGNVYNAVHLDASDVPGGSGTLIPNLETSALTSVSVDLGALFPGASAATTFTIHVHTGNVTAPIPNTFGRIDNVRLLAGTPLDANTVLFSNPAPGLVGLDIHTVDPFTQYYNLLSLNVSGPVGGGPALGLYLDSLLFLVLTLPLGTTGVHATTNGLGDTNVLVPAAINPSGLTFDYVLITLGTFGTVDDFTAAQRFVWP